MTAIIVGDFNTPLTLMDRSPRKKINREKLALNDTLDQVDFIYMYRTCQRKAVEYTFFSSAHGTLSGIDHMLGHKQISINLRRLKSYQTSFLTTTVGN